MLDPRIYRAALLPIVLAVIVCAFSLADRPAPLTTTLATESFSDGTAQRALARVDAWARAYPSRRPGDAADAALARDLAEELRALGSFQVSVEDVEAQTVDGDRRLTTVIARQVGRPGPGLVVVAHRDAAGRGARAELSGTAAMLELARIVANGKAQRTITFVSTSGGSGGAGGARDLPRHLSGDTDAVLVLGDVAGREVRRPFVVGWSTAPGTTPLRLRRTVEAAVRVEAGTNPGGARAWTQWAQLALPLATGEQGPLLEAGLPAVLLSVSGERATGADAPIDDDRIFAFGRSALRVLLALDAAPTLGEGPQRDLVTMRKVLPEWAARLLVLSLLLAPVLVAVDGFARVRRRGAGVGAGLAWLAVAALPVLVACAFVALLGWSGLVAAAPPVPVEPGAIDRGGAAVAAMACAALVLALGWLLLRAPLLRAAGAPLAVRGAGAAIALLLAWCGLALVVWVFNPYAGALYVLGAHLLPAAVAPEARLGRAAGVALAALAAAPFGLVLATHALALDAGPLDLAWTVFLMFAGGAVGPSTWLVWSATVACLLAGLALAWRAPREPRTARDVRSRGPLSYAGPGSLGGTDSALRR